MHADLNLAMLSADDQQCQMQGFTELYVCQYVLYRAHRPGCINAVNELIVWNTKALAEEESCPRAVKATESE